jgi:hypothetical protein
MQYPSKFQKIYYGAHPCPAFVFFFFFFFFWFFNFFTPPTYYPTTYLFTYQFKMCYSHPHSPTRPTTNLPTNILNGYLPNPTYMATPTHLVGSPIDPPTVENDQEK